MRNERTELESYGRARIAEGWKYVMSPTTYVSRSVFPPGRRLRLWLSALVGIAVCVGIVVGLALLT